MNYLCTCTTWLLIIINCAYKGVQKQHDQSHSHNQYWIANDYSKNIADILIWRRPCFWFILFNFAHNMAKVNSNKCEIRRETCTVIVLHSMINLCTATLRISCVSSYNAGEHMFNRGKIFVHEKSQAFSRWNILLNKPV